MGSKTYEHYNAVGRYMDAKLDKLGAKRFFERGEGDDDSALEEDFNKWKKRMWPTLCKTMGLDANDVSKTEDEKLYHILITLFLLLFLLFGYSYFHLM